MSFEHEVAIGVGVHLLERLPGVLGEDLLEQVAHAEDLLGRQLEVGHLAVADRAVGLVEQDPGVLIVGQPTRGVDVGAIEFIHKQLIAMRDRGKAVLLVSVELDEIRSLSDRILVMFDGRIVGERGPEATEGELGLLMAGVEKQEAAE